MTKNRVESFSDGVFAIVITLLVLDIRLPEGELSWALLATAVPHLLAFLLSFVIVGTYWVAHHTMWTFIARVDRPLLWTNLFVLLTVVFIPFPAALLGAHPLNPVAIIIYGASLALTNAAGAVLWLVAGARGAMRPGVPDSFRRSTSLFHAAPIPIYLIGIAIAYFVPWLSLALYVVPPLFFVLPNALTDRRLALALDHLEKAEG